jgi:hypothetical protein
MNLGQISSTFRFMMDEASTKRFTAADVSQLATRAQNQLAFEVDFPQATQNYLLVTGQQEYQLQELMKIMRVYIATFDPTNPNFPYVFKQELIGTDIYTLEGDILQQYDNTSGRNPNYPQQTSQYIAQPPEAYPILNAPGGGPYPTKLPWQGHYQNPNGGWGSRPQYYLRGGYLGVVPIPVQNTAPSPLIYLLIDFIPEPPALVNSFDNSIFPAIFLEAISWKMVEYASYSDHNSAMVQAQQMYQKEVTDKINPWIQRIQATKPKTLVPITKRTYFQRGGTSGRGGGWGI